MMAEYVLQVEHLRKIYGKREVLKDVSFTLTAGDAAALLGPKGAGKTTLIRVLAGMAVPEEGSVSLFGSGNGRELRLARQKAGFLVDSPVCYEHLPAHRNLRIRAGLYGRSDAEYLRELRRDLHLTQKYDVGRRQPMKLLGLGEKARYALAAALVHRPQLLVLDEPFTGLDPENSGLVLDLLTRLRDEGITLLISDQRAEGLRQLCPQALLLNEGSLTGPTPIDMVGEME